MTTSRTENVIATLVIYAINRGIFTAYVANSMTINGAHNFVCFRLFQLAHFITVSGDPPSICSKQFNAVFSVHLLQDAVVILVDDRPRPGHSAYVMLLLLGERGAELTYPCSPPVYVNSLLALYAPRASSTYTTG